VVGNTALRRIDTRRPLDDQLGRLRLHCL